MAFPAILPYRLRRRLAEAWYRRAVGRIFLTPPIGDPQAGVIFVSMLCHADVAAYLVAIKSICARVGLGRHVVIDDGSLTAKDQVLLAHHLRGLRIVPIASVDTGSCPRGGTWERLLTILDLSREAYVIQVDADLLALGPMTEVADAIAANRAFTLSGDEDCVGLVSMAEIAALSRANSTDHVQTHAQIAMGGCPELADHRYGRGCSGFAGFPRNTAGRALAERLSTLMEARLGAKWRDWGSEQVCSNFVIANFPQALMLPYGRYISYLGRQAPGEVALVHFLGSFRYRGGHYTKLSARFAESLPRR
ncbi:hypothetical protein CKO38_15270 [Rhodospirillum rubrum]|uniref:hypothetical protein n=1 Tax=Rhodospirillum rubrum TaxID=1085 RepID=UPI001904FBA2|nr:hypothetical protein [Rhodospirillum rubrum]MBK1665878.1 hypothetical protein [Rhodospirillum rubrum]MBK1678007.1 hypothetical protein [Rhodospirillum rubrum]